MCGTRECIRHEEGSVEICRVHCGDAATGSGRNPGTITGLLAMAHWDLHCPWPTRAATPCPQVLDNYVADCYILYFNKA